MSFFPPLYPLLRVVERSVVAVLEPVTSQHLQNLLCCVWNFLPSEMRPFRLEHLLHVLQADIHSFPDSYE